MAYVALSRVKSLDGLRIQGRIAPQALRAGGPVHRDAWPAGDGNCPLWMALDALLGPSAPALRTFTPAQACTACSTCPEAQ